MKRLPLGLVWGIGSIAQLCSFCFGCGSNQPDTTNHDFEARFVNGTVGNYARFSAQDCRLEHCDAQLAACAQEPDCTEQFECLRACVDVMGTQEAYTRCSLRCNLLLTPASAAYQELIGCALSNGCSSEYAAGCPTVGNPQVLRALTPDQLEGVWFNAAGYNLGRDCFDCSFSTFTMGNVSDVFPKTTRRLDWFMDDLGMRRFQGEFELGGAGHPGTAVFSYPHLGVTFVEYYNVVYFDDRTDNEVLVLVGCGGPGLDYDTAYAVGMVLTRQLVTEFELGTAEAINAALAAAKISLPPGRADVTNWCLNGFFSCLSY
jgi:hypothetical protein